MAEKLSPEIPSRAKLIFFRWLSVLSCGVVAAGVWIVIQPLLEMVLDWITVRLGSLQGGVLASMCLVLGGASLWKVGHGRWLALTGFSRVGLSYPPLWFASIGAMLLWMVVATDWVLQFKEATRTLTWSVRQIPGWSLLAQISVWGKFGLAFTLLVVTAITLFQVWRKAKKANEKNSHGDEKSQKSIADRGVDELIEWLKSDAEVVTRGGDLFGHRVVADRIYGRLSSAEGEAPTIAVVGPLGSGKSTIRGLVEERFKGHDTIRMVSLSVWPFDTPEAAVEGILNAIIRTLRQEVGTLALTGLPNEYIRAIEHAAGRWRGVVNLLQPDCAPDALIERLGKVACAAGIIIVLWIEDMERFSGSDRLSGEAALKREAERLGPIRSMLYLLDRCPSITVVLSDASLRSRFDVAKIARFVETPPRLSPELVWKVIGKLRSHCLSGNFIDPASKQYRESLTPPEEDWRLSLWLTHTDYPEVRVPEAVALLLASPRKLKSALRICLEIWGKVAGEIDFDSVLAALALKVGRPDVFEFVGREIDFFREGPRGQLSGPGMSWNEHPILQRLDTLLENEVDEKLRNAVKEVLFFVFPCASGNRDSRHVHLQQPQSLCVSRHTDYWLRFLSLPDIPNDASDQSALSSIESWLSGQKNDLVSRMLDAKKSAQIETFAACFRPVDLCRLLDEVARESAYSDASDWDLGGHPPGVVPVWRMMLDHNPPPEAIGEVIRCLIRDLLPKNIPLVRKIHYYFAVSHRSSPWLLNDSVRRSVDGELYKVFRNSFGSERWKEFLGAMREGSPWTIYWLASGMGVMLGNGRLNSRCAHGWGSVSGLLLRAAEKEPERAVPLIVPFITESKRAHDVVQDEEVGGARRVSYEQASFKEQVAKDLFDFKRLCRIIAATDLPEEVDEHIRIRFDAAKEAVRSNHAELLVDASDPDDLDDQNES